MKELIDNGYSEMDISEILHNIKYDSKLILKDIIFILCQPSLPLSIYILHLNIQNNFMYFVK